MASGRNSRIGVESRKIIKRALLHWTDILHDRRPYRWMRNTEDERVWSSACLEQLLAEHIIAAKPTDTCN